MAYTLVFKKPFDRRQCLLQLVQITRRTDGQAYTFLPGLAAYGKMLRPENAYAMP